MKLLVAWLVIASLMSHTWSVAASLVYGLPHVHGHAHEDAQGQEDDHVSLHDHDLDRALNQEPGGSQQHRTSGGDAALHRQGHQPIADHHHGSDESDVVYVIGSGADPGAGDEGALRHPWQSLPDMLPSAMAGELPPAARLRFVAPVQNPFKTRNPPPPRHPPRT